MRIGEERALITASINVDGVLNAKELRVGGKDVCNVCGTGPGTGGTSATSLGATDSEEKETNSVIVDYKVVITQRPLCAIVIPPDRYKTNIT